MVKPRLVAQAVIAWQYWAIVIDFEFATARGRIFMLIDVVDLIGCRAFTKVGRAAEEIDTRLFWSVSYTHLTLPTKA